MSKNNEYDKVQRNELWLMSMLEAKHQNGYANVAWLIAKWLKRKRVGSQKEHDLLWAVYYEDGEENEFID